MAYTPKTDWDDAPPQTPDTTPKAVDANRWEQGIKDAHDELATLNAAMADKIDKPATPATGDLLRFNGTVWVQSATQFHEGTGNPNGVVTAPYGSRFVNTEVGGYNGAREWKKTTPTGNTGWVAKGDTGWRNISDLLTAGLALSSNNGNAHIRRIDSLVIFRFKLDVSGAGINSLGSIPAGFRQGAFTTDIRTGQAYQATVAGASGSVLTNLLPCYVSNTAWRIYGALPNPGTVLWYDTTSTDDAWPTTLPGSPA